LLQVPLGATHMVVLVLFAGGMLALLVGLFISAVEIRISHRAVDFEVQRVLSLHEPAKPSPTDRPR